MNCKLPFLVISLIIFNNRVSAQRDLSRYEIGLTAGTFIYQGDLTPEMMGSFRTPGPAFGLQLTRILRPSLSLRGDLNFGRLSGDDSKYSAPEWRRQRNFAFKTQISEATLSLIWSPVYITPRLRPYVFAGAGLALIRVRRDFSDFNPEYFAGENLVVRLAEDVNTKIPRIIPIIPVGGGLRYYLSDRISLSAEASYRYATTDYLDGFSKAANSALSDKYFKYSFGITYSFKKKNQWDCPVLLP